MILDGLEDPAVVGPSEALCLWAIGTRRNAAGPLPRPLRERIAGNAHIFDVTLADEDKAIPDALDQTKGTGRARERM